MDLYRKTQFLLSFEKYEKIFKRIMTGSTRPFTITALSTTKKEILKMSFQ